MTARILIDEDVGRAEVVNDPPIGITKACYLGVELRGETSGYSNLTKTGFCLSYPTVVPVTSREHLYKL